MNRLLFWSLFPVMLLIAGCSKPKEADTDILEILAGYENAEFVLQSMDWEGNNDVSVTSDVSGKSKHLLPQYMTLQNYCDPFQHSSGLVFSSVRQSQPEDDFGGTIDVMLVVEDFMEDTYSKERNIPSIIAPFSLFSTFSIQFKYRISPEGELSYDSHYEGGRVDEYSDYSTKNHLTADIVELSDEKVVISFPDYLIPDFCTDSFLTGKVVMTYVRK